MKQETTLKRKIIYSKVEQNSEKKTNYSLLYSKIFIPFTPNLTQTENKFETVTLSIAN